jgi:two-component system response regulator NreC
MVRVALLDGHELVRIGLKTVLKQDDDIEVIADISDSHLLLDLVQAQHPDLILIDIADKGDTSRVGAAVDDSSVQVEKSQKFRMIESLRKTNPGLKVVLMSTVFSLDCLLYTLRGNVAGYLLKSVSPEELIAAVHATACGGVYIHADLMEYVPKNMLRNGTRIRQSQSAIPDLSEREQEILDLLVKGHTNREISEKLYLSPKTVEAYRAKLYTKLGVKTRADLVSYAVARGLVAF